MFTATMKSLLARKVRLVLSGLAVVLGVMAVSGALVLTDTLSRSFDTLFQTVNTDLDVQVSGEQPVTGETGGPPVTTPVPAAVVDRVAGVPGVRAATGDVVADGARVIGPDGKVIRTQGPPPFGVSWRGENGLIELREGRGPAAPDEIAVNAGLAKSGGFTPGDRVQVLTTGPKQTFTLVGVFGYSGGRDSLAGETRVAFTEPVAQRLMLGGTGLYTAVNVEAAEGVSREELRDRIRSAVGSRYLVRTLDQVVTEQAAGVGQFLGTLRNLLLGFAGVALFVGSFLILNTFSILVAQRTRELALFRALGAGRGQIVRSVLAEAMAVGLVASTLGLFAGMGVAALLKTLMAAAGGPRFPGAGVSVPASTVIASYAVGMLVTLVAALLPAVRASRVPPVAAMRDAAGPDKPLTRLTAAGTVVTLLGAAGVGSALFGGLFGGSGGGSGGGGLGGGTLGVLLGGVLLVFAGVAMLIPAVSRPATSVLGRAVSWSVAGRLGQRNSARNPRRTAITAAALMVGIALVTGVSVLADSFRASIDKQVTQDLGADLVISGDAGWRPPTYDPAVISAAARIPGVETAAGLYSDPIQDGTDVVTAGAGDVAALSRIFDLEPAAGELRTLRTGEIVVDGDFAAAHGLSPGDPVRLATQRGGGREYTVVGVYESSGTLGVPVLLSVPDATSGFRSPQPTRGFIDAADDAGSADVAAIRQRVAGMLADNPEVSVGDRSDYAEQQSSQVDTLVIALFGLLGLAVVIAVLGIVNTLALSVLERTRELGLVRAVGMRRFQVIQMVTAESVVISVFGALLGVAVGSVLGAAVVRALRDEGIGVLAFPWTSLGAFVALGVAVGLVAAVIPAVRASRTDVLRAISYE